MHIIRAIGWGVFLCGASLSCYFLLVSEEVGELVILPVMLLALPLLFLGVVIIVFTGGEEPLYGL